LKKHEKTMKFWSEMRGFGYPKTSESVELSAISWFLGIHENDGKRCQKESQKSCFLEQNGDMDLPGST
jgi:hypothetical protein